MIILGQVESFKSKSGSNQFGKKREKLEIKSNWRIIEIKLKDTVFKTNKK